MKTKDKAPSPTVKRRKETARMQVTRSIPKGRPGRATASVDNEPKASTSAEDEPGQYEVEAIVDHKEHQRGGRKYLVKWKGYPEDQNTWEPVNSLLGCRDLLAEYDKTHAPETDAEADADTAEESEYAGDGSEGYEVENVMSYSDTDEGRYYMIKWKGWAGSYWEPEANLDHCPEILEKFWDERGGRPLKTANGQRRANATNRGRPKAQNGVVKKKPVKPSKLTEKTTKDSGEERAKRRTARERNGGRENSARLDGHTGSHESQPKSSISQDGGRRANQMRRKREDTPQPTSSMKTRYVKNKEVLGDYLETAFGHDLSGSLTKKKRNPSESEEEDSPPPKRRVSKAAAEEEPVEDNVTMDGYEAEGDREQSHEKRRHVSREVDDVPRKSHKGADKPRHDHTTLKYSAYKKIFADISECWDSLDGSGAGEFQNEPMPRPRRMLSKHRLLLRRFRIKFLVESLLEVRSSAHLWSLTAHSVRLFVQGRGRACSSVVSQFVPLASRDVLRRFSKTSGGSYKGNTNDITKTHRISRVSMTMAAVSLVTMDGVQFTGKRNILFNPDNVSDWSAWEYDESKQIDPEEKVHVIGRSISVKPELNFYICVQGASPDLLCGITRKDMKKKFPKTINWLDNSKILTADNDDEDGGFSEEEDLPMGFSHRSEGRASDTEADGAPDDEQEV